MTKRRKVSVIVAKNRHEFLGHRKVVPILTGTVFASGSDSGRAVGAISITGSQAGATNGNCYICIDTAGTGTIINA